MLQLHKRLMDVGQSMTDGQVMVLDLSKWERATLVSICKRMPTRVAGEALPILFGVLTKLGEIIEPIVADDEDDPIEGEVDVPEKQIPEGVEAEAGGGGTEGGARTTVAEPAIAAAAPVSNDPELALRAQQIGAMSKIQLLELLRSRLNSVKGNLWTLAFEQAEINLILTALSVRTVPWGITDDLEADRGKVETILTRLNALQLDVSGLG